MTELHKITFMVETPEGVDPANILDGATMAEPYLKSCIVAECYLEAGTDEVKVLEQETCVESVVTIKLKQGNPPTATPVLLT